MDIVEEALAKAINAEVDERRPGWEARVAILASELQARRRAREDVPSLATHRLRSLERPGEARLGFERG